MKETQFWTPIRRKTKSAWVPADIDSSNSLIIEIPFEWKNHFSRIPNFKVQNIDGRLNLRSDVVLRNEDDLKIRGVKIVLD